VRDFAYASIYHRPESLRQAEAVRVFLPHLVEALCEERRIIEAPENAADAVVRHLAVAYVAGSTDRHTIRTARRLGVAIPPVLAETAA
jgi:dGTP triphosphohydrolase